MTESLTDIRGAALRDYIESLPEVTWISVESDQHVYRLMAAIDRFRFIDDEWFDFEDPSALPKGDSMREIVELLTCPRNSELVCGYYKRECQGELNPSAERTWSYLHARIQGAEQGGADQPTAAVDLKSE